MREIKVYKFKEKKPETGKYVAVLVNGRICVGRMLDEVDIWRKLLDNEKYSSKVDQDHILSAIHNLEQTEARFSFEWIFPEGDESTMYEMADYEWCYWS